MGGAGCLHLRAPSRSSRSGDRSGPSSLMTAGTLCPSQVLAGPAAVRPAASTSPPVALALPPHPSHAGPLAGPVSPGGASGPLERPLPPPSAPTAHAVGAASLPTHLCSRSNALFPAEPLKVLSKKALLCFFKNIFIHSIYCYHNLRMCLFTFYCLSFLHHSINMVFIFILGYFLK